MSDVPIGRISNNKETSFVWSFHDDLATVSCYAAGEVDELILGRANHFDAIKRLLEIIKTSLIAGQVSTSPQSLIDPTTAVAMNRALVSSDPTLSMETIGELLEKSSHVAELLERVIAEPEKVKETEEEELVRLRSLCLELSNSALACEEPIEDIQPQLP